MLLEGCARRQPRFSFYKQMFPPRRASAPRGLRGTPLATATINSVIMGILFCTPAYGGQVTEPHFRSCLSVTWDLVSAGIKHDWATGRNESLINRARNEMTASFLAKDFSHQMWVDADIQHTSDDVAKLWNLQTDIAVGFYSMKLPEKPLSAWKDGKLVRLEDCPKEPFEVDYAGTGFMLISKAALEKIIKHVERKHIRSKEILEQIKCEDDFDRSLCLEMADAMAASYEGQNGRTPCLYKVPVYRDGLESEDYNFCRNAREAGLKIIGDPSINLTHWGQYGYGA